MTLSLIQKAIIAAVASILALAQSSAHGGWHHRSDCDGCESSDSCDRCERPCLLRRLENWKLRTFPFPLGHRPWCLHRCRSCDDCPCDSYDNGFTQAVPLMTRRPAVRVLPPVVIPPGTLGCTYQRVSTPVPEDEHPRTGMLEICNVPAGLTASIRGMEGYRGTDGVWYFKTNRPLLPCRPSVFTVTFTPDGPCPRVGPGNCGPRVKRNYRVFRLIAGRIVYLRY